MKSKKNVIKKLKHSDIYTLKTITVNNVILHNEVGFNTSDSLTQS